MKVSGSYESVTKGVSEQVPQDRRPGQHFEQINMLSDPVRGLARRHGSKMQDERIIDIGAAFATMEADSLRHNTFTFYVDGTEYDLVYRTQASLMGYSGFAWAHNKDTGQFIDIVYNDPDTILDNLVDGGVSAATNVGKYIFLAGNAITPTWTPTDSYDNPTNRQRMVAWVRGGAFSRTFKLMLIKADGTKDSVEYKTVSASYPNLLDTSDIPFSDPEYQKLVNDRVNAYNGEVTKWIGTAAEDITPENIASKLYDELVLLGITCTLRDSTVFVDDADYVEIQCDDGGDGSLMRGVGNEVPLPDAVSIVHYAGKVVRVQPKKANSDDAFYLMAVAKDPTQSGLTEVSWQECAGYTMLPLEVFIFGTVKDETLYLASTAADLAVLTGEAVPDYKANSVGDDVTCPLPYFFGKRINYLGIFQDRLVIGSGAVLFFSRPGDYLNWFRGSVLTIVDSDPVEMYALGSEDDVITTSTTYDRNLLLFGRRLQYTVNGRQPLTPKGASIVILSAHEDAVDAKPQNSGNYVFYGKSRNNVSSMHQIQIGLLADSPESYNVSQQLDQYLAGKPVEIVCLTAPNVVALRTDGPRNQLYVYTYLDSPSGTERLFDAWSRWQWHGGMGSIVGMSRHDGDLLVYMLRLGMDRDGVGQTWIACERFVLDSSLSDYPYADSLRPVADALSPGANSFLFDGGSLNSDAIVAMGKEHTAFLVGTPFSAFEDFIAEYEDDLDKAWVGIDYPAYAEPTNPYVRDKNDQAIVNGRLTLGRVIVSVADTAGLTIDLTTVNGTRQIANFSGRNLAAIQDQVGRQPVVTTAVSASIGKEVRDCRYRINAKTWLPLTVTSIEWSGQFFQNARRV